MSTDSTAGNEQPEMQGVAGATDDGRVYVVTPQGMAVEGPPREEAATEGEPKSVTDMVEQPAKVMRIGNMIRQLLAEVKSAPLDDASRQRLRAIHQTSIEELKQGLAPELAEELERLTLPFSEDATPSDAELRIAQAQLVGWLEGLFHGIQTALFAQQMAARAQLEQMRRALPAGPVPPCLPATRGQRRDVPLRRSPASQPHWLSLISRIWPTLLCPIPRCGIGQSLSSPLTGRALTVHLPSRTAGHPTPAAIISLAQKRLAVCSGGMTFAGPRFQGSV